MAHGINHGDHGSVSSPAGASALSGANATAGSDFNRVLSQTAAQLGVDQGELSVAMHEAEALYAGREGMSEDQKLSAMMDHITGRLNLSDLSNDDMMMLAELCRLCLDQWEHEAALEEGVIIEQGSFSPLTAGLAGGGLAGGLGGMNLGAGGADAMMLDLLGEDVMRRLRAQQAGGATG
ncbi:MAG: DUF1244 domain-containing protein [Salinarimonadaceae bacterium]|nr:MAG: DUF1244 domain-containing protein [Salinarimonadaceae bacterium]